MVDDRISADFSSFYIYCWLRWSTKTETMTTTFRQSFPYYVYEVAKENIVRDMYIIDRVDDCLNIPALTIGRSRHMLLHHKTHILGAFARNSLEYSPFQTGRGRLQPFTVNREDSVST